MSVVLLLLMLTMPESEQNVITTTQGKLRGDVHDGYVSYRGIPYASIASADDKFKRAGIAPRWSGVRQSHESLCSPASGEECLQLDVHVPSTAGAPWPVLLWIAGGTGQYYPGKLVKESIIVVVVYHRLGPLGFLCLDEDKIPGNAGVKDVVIALRWVRDNIIAFDGNPSKVVMAGQSLGAAMAEAVMLSPMSIGLYHGVILQSGSVLAPWAFNYDAKDRAVKLGRMFYDYHNISEMFLKAKTEELVSTCNKLDIAYFPFGMCVENAMKHEERLLEEAPYDLLTSSRVGKVPMIIGYNKDEAYIFASTLQDSRVTRTMTRGIEFLLPDELRFINEREMLQVARQMEDLYFTNNKTMRAVLEYHRDAYFVSHIYRSVRFHASSHHPLYFYQFSHASEEIGVVVEPGLQKTGPAHSDELGYLFSTIGLAGDEERVQMQLVKLWTNFVKYLDPTYQGATRWEAFDSDHARLLDIGEELKMINFPHYRAAAAWDDVYNKYYYTRNKV